MNETRPVCVVTGGSSGVGAATARWLAARDFDVVVNYRRDRDAADAVVDACRQNGDAIAVEGDISHDEDCRRIAKAAFERYGRIDALVNSAGTTQFVPMNDLAGLDASDFQRVFAVNTIGAYQMIRAVLAAMRRSGGAVVNVSSIAAISGIGSSYAYIASKAALNSITIALARQLAPEIRVNAVAPGMIEGRWLLEGLGKEKYERAKERYAADSALGQNCTPADIAEAVGWLIAGSPVVTGQILTVDAGASLGKPPVLVER